MVGCRDWVGVRQGSLYVTRRVGSSHDRQALWECRCDCGAVVAKTSGALGAGRKSCSTGCGVSTSNRRRTQHGLANSKEHRAWQAMKQRCLNPENPNYKSYGARGISIHPAWVDSFADFIGDVGPAPGEGRHISLDRIDNDGNYEPGNVRWVTSATEQLRNQRRTRRVEFGGEQMCLLEAADRAGIPRTTVDARWRRGVRGDNLFAPVKRPDRYTLNGVSKTLPQWAAESGVKLSTVRARLKLGASLADALSPEKQKTEPYKYTARSRR